MKRNTRKALYLLFLILILGAYYFFKNTESAPDSREVTVIDILDGDTVVIDDANHSRVRYLDIDTPEIPLQNSPGDPMALEAWDFNSDLVDGKKVRLKFDEQKYDPYGRILAHVYVNDLLVNEELLKQGLATVLIIEPNDRYSEIMHAAEDEARKQKRGIWGSLKTLLPPEGNSRFQIDLDNMSRYEEKRVVINGLVKDSRKSDKVIVLNMQDMVDIVIFSDDWNNFEHFGIDPENYYNGKHIEVIGRVRMQKGKPGMVVDHPMLLRSLD
jgi:micrococcal nuclease